MIISEARSSKLAPPIRLVVPRDAARRARIRWARHALEADAWASSLLVIALEAGTLIASRRPDWRTRMQRAGGALARVEARVRVSRVHVETRVALTIGDHVR